MPLIAVSMASTPTLQLGVGNNLLHPDGTVQTTSQVTLEQFPSFISGNDVQLFAQTHAAIHHENVRQRAVVQSQPCHSTRCSVRDRSRRSRTDPRSRAKSSASTGTSHTASSRRNDDPDDDDNWGQWKSHTRDDRDNRRPGVLNDPPSSTHQSQQSSSPRRTTGDNALSRSTACSRKSRVHVEAQRHPVLHAPQRSSPGFFMRGSWKKSWETIYRSHMPLRAEILRDTHRVRAISEFVPARLPEGEPGNWTRTILGDISCEFGIHVKDLPEQLSVQGDCWSIAAFYSTRPA